MNVPKQIGTNEHNFHTYHCASNKVELGKSKLAGCFFCQRIFDAKQIQDWVNDKRGETVVCPYCKTDSVYGDASGNAVNEENLAEMHTLWF